MRTSGSLFLVSYSQNDKNIYIFLNCGRKFQSSCQKLSTDYRNDFLNCSKLLREFLRRERKNVRSSMLFFNIFVWLKISTKKIFNFSNN